MNAKVLYWVIEVNGQAVACSKTEWDALEVKDLLLAQKEYGYIDIIPVYDCWF